MTMQSQEDNYLTIQLLRYDKPNGLTERYFFLEMSTLQATTLLAPDRKIVSSQIVAYTDRNVYLSDQAAREFKTITDFNDFFIRNTDYHIHDCKIELGSGTIINSHDDGEVSIQLPSDSVDQGVVNSIFEKYNLDKTLIIILKNRPGRYFAIDKENNVTADFENFDEYVRNRI